MTNLKKEFLTLLKNKKDLRWDDLREARNALIEKGLLKEKEGKKAGYFFAFLELLEDLKKGGEIIHISKCPNRYKLKGE